MASITGKASLTAASAVGAGATVDFATARNLVSAILSGTGTVTDGVVTVEASHDAVSWVAINQFMTRSTASQHFDLVEGAYRYFRANIVRAVAGGGSVTVTFMEAD